MDRDNTQPQEPIQPAQPEPAFTPAPQSSPMTQAPAESFVSPTSAASPVLQQEPALAAEQPMVAIQQAPAQALPASQPDTYAIDAKITPVEVEGADDLIATMHRHEKTSSVIVIVVIVLLSVLWFGLAYRVHSIRTSNKVVYEQQLKKASPEFRAQEAEASFGKEIVDRPDGTLDVSTEPENLYLAKDQDVKPKVGQQVNFYNGASFIVTDMQPGWKPTDKDAFYQAKPGYKFVKLNMLLGNRAKDAASLTFEYYTTQAGQEIRLLSKSLLPIGTFEAGVVDFSISSGSLNKAQTVKAGIVLEVPKNAKDLILVDKGGAIDKNGDYVSTIMKARYTL